MADSNAYDIRQKLLEMQNQLLKDAGQNSNIIPGSHKSPDPKEAEFRENTSTENDVVSLLKDISLTQHKMLALLSEINSKIK